MNGKLHPEIFNNYLSALIDQYRDNLYTFIDEMKKDLNLDTTTPQEELEEYNEDNLERDFEKLKNLSKKLKL